MMWYITTGVIIFMVNTGKSYTYVETRGHECWFMDRQTKGQGFITDIVFENAIKDRNIIILNTKLSKLLYLDAAHKVGFNLN